MPFPKTLRLTSVNAKKARALRKKLKIKAGEEKDYKVAVYENKQYTVFNDLKSKRAIYQFMKKGEFNEKSIN